MTSRVDSIKKQIAQLQKELAVEEAKAEVVKPSRLCEQCYVIQPHDKVYDCSQGHVTCHDCSPGSFKCKLCHQLTCSIPSHSEHILTRNGTGMSFCNKCAKTKFLQCRNYVKND